MKFLKRISDEHGFFIKWRNPDRFPYNIVKRTIMGLVYGNENGMVYSPHGAGAPLLDYSTINPPRLVNFSGISTYMPNKPRRFVIVNMEKESGRTSYNAK